MPARTFRDIATSLSGSAFRRVVHDGRTRMLREIHTMGERDHHRPRHGSGQPRSSRPEIARRPSNPAG